MMATPYTSAVGAMPDPGSAAWLGWYHDLVAFRKAEAPIARATTYYITQTDPGGSFLGESPDTPIYCANLAALQSALSTYGGSGVAILVERGSEWYCASGDGLTIPSGNFTLGAYGTGENPIVHGTQTIGELGGSSWTDNMDGTYSITIAGMTGKTFNQLIHDWGDYASVRDFAKDTTDRYERRATTGEVVSSGIYHFNSSTNVLTVYPTAVTGTPSLTNLRVVVHAAGNFDLVIVGNYDGVRVDSWNAIGAGGTTAQSWNFKSEHYGTKTHVYSNCVAAHGALHNAGQLTNAGNAGGYMLWDNCVIGWVNDVTGVPFVAYNYDGDQECITHNCWVGGYHIDWTNDANRYRCAQALYSHTNGGADITSLFLVQDCYVWGGYAGCNAMGWCGDPPNTKNWIAGDDANECRVIFADCEYDGGSHGVALNAGNETAIIGVRAGHVQTRVKFTNITHDAYAAGIQFNQLNSSNYDFSGWFLTGEYLITIEPLTGNVNGALCRNNSNDDAGPAFDGTAENYMAFITWHITLKNGYTATGDWNGWSFDQRAQYDAVDGLDGWTGGPVPRSSNNMNWINCVVVCNNLSASRNPSMCIMRGDPRTTGIWTEPIANETVYGGAAHCSFYGILTTDLSSGNRRQLGVQYLLDNLDCDAFSALPTWAANQTQPPSQETDGAVTGDLATLPSHCGTVDLDIDGRSRVANGARGAREMVLPGGEARAGGPSIAIAIMV